jgi:hypothetical protein
MFVSIKADDFGGRSSRCEGLLHPRELRFRFEPSLSGGRELKLEAIAQFAADEAGIVEVETADGDGVVEQDAVVGDVDGAGGDAPALA